MIYIIDAPSAKPWVCDHDRSSLPNLFGPTSAIPKFPEHVRINPWRKAPSNLRPKNSISSCLKPMCSSSLGKLVAPSPPTMTYRSPETAPCLCKSTIFTKVASPNSNLALESPHFYFCFFLPRIYFVCQIGFLVSLLDDKVANPIKKNKQKQPTYHQWIGLRENLQETMVFTIKYRVFL